MSTDVFEAYTQGKNIFMTGPAGTGKTYTIQKIYEHALMEKTKVKVTALTGVAAVLLNCNATTLHSWAGVGHMNKSIFEIVNKISKSKFYAYNWENTDLLIVDEISMMSEKLFTLLDKIGKKIRMNDKPFGGIQLIFAGDFFQLPPVQTDQFCFESPIFKKTFDCLIQLKKVYRQNDMHYKKILLNMRKGLISKKSIELFQSKLVQNDKTLNENIIRLVPTKNKALEINEFFMKQIKEKKYIYNRVCKESSNNLSNLEKFKLDLLTKDEKENEYKFIKETNLTEEKLYLKKGCFVMCVANIDMENGIVNGSVGKVIDFSEKRLPIVEFQNIIMEVGKKEWKSENIPGISVLQVPLILAWSLTIHKSQGLTLEKCIIDLGKDIFEAGQMYVALSRLKNLDGLYLSHFDIKNLTINKKVLEFYETLDA